MIKARGWSYQAIFLQDGSMRTLPSAHWSLRPLPSCIFSRGEAVRRPLPTIMHFFHEMGSWKYFGLIGNALLYSRRRPWMIYIYTTFQNKKDFDGEDIETNYPRDTIVIIHFFPRDRAVCLGL
jgi:hypothetical protein